MSRHESGISLVELLAVLAIIGLGIGAASLYLKPMEAPLDAAADMVEGTLRAARLKAMATTSGYRVSPNGGGSLTVEQAPSCSAASWSADPGLALTLPDGVGMTALDWSVCFSSRGVANSNVTIRLTHSEYGSREVEVLLGGTTRIRS